MRTKALDASAKERLWKASRGLAPSQHPVNQIAHDEATTGERLADKIAAGIGSWTFLIIQTAAVLAWVTLNIIGLVNHWDPFPFILLNLLFSVQAAYTGPVLLLAGNRQAQKDRMTLEHTASEADIANQQNREILLKIAENTELTLQVLQHIADQRADFMRRLEEAGVIKPEPAPAAKPASTSADASAAKATRTKPT